MKFLVLFFTLIASAYAGEINNKTIKVAILDTGLDLNDPRFKEHICPNGHQDFTGLGMKDTNSHGTHVAGIIENNAGSGNYCFLIYKYYDDSQLSSIDTRNEILSIEKAIENGAQIINISGGGPEFNEEEYLLIRDHPRTTFVVSAGNENKNLDGTYYPASLYIKLKNIVVVGALDRYGTRAPFSNWSSKTIYWEPGVDIVSTLPSGKEGIKSGTSQACAIRTGKLIRKILNESK